MARCKICGRNLNVLESLRCVTRKGGYVYPVRRVDGNRTDEVVRFLCRGCLSRAARHQAAREPGTEPRARGEQPERWKD